MSDTTAEMIPNDENLRQATIGIWHQGCWALELNERFAGAQVIERSSYQAGDHINADLIISVDDASELDTVLDSVGGHENVYSLRITKKTDKKARVLISYDNSWSVIPQITDLDLIAVEPYQIKDNYKYWTVVAQASRLPEQINRLDEKFQVQVKSVRDLSTADTVEHVDVINRLFDDSLSARQREAILTAARHGYYQWPRAASADDIADEMNISSPTFLEHLRTAEQKVMSRLFQHLNEQNQHRINQLE